MSEGARRSALGPSTGSGQAARPFEPLAAVEELAEGTLLARRLSDGTPVCLFNHAGTIGAVHDCCTHAEFAMSEGALHADGTIECVWHGARFDCATGAVRKAPAFDPLPVYEVRVEDGRVLVGPLKDTR